jgi:hypothetical protein
MFQPVRTMKSLGCLESLGGKPFDLTDALNMMARDPEPEPLTEPQEGSVVRTT